MSKVIEKFVFQWLMEFIGPKLDKDQFCATKGKSITNFLIELVNFILFNQDLKNPRAVLCLMVDLCKAFNRVEHSDVVTSLHEMGTPAWQLKIVIGFLKNRKLRVKMNGKSSSTKDMPGGGPQGTILGLRIFIIDFNLVGNSSSSSSLGEFMTAPASQRKEMDNKKCKYVDDLTMAKSIELKSKLIKGDECQLSRLLDFHQRTEHYMSIENNEMQKVNL